MFTATASSVEGALRHRVAVNGRHEITTDEPISVGGFDTAPAPHELLPAMLAACVSTMIVLYAQKRAWDLGDISVDVAYNNETTPREVSTRIHLPDGLSDDLLRGLMVVAQTCPVKRALEAGFSFEQEIVTRAVPYSA